MNARTTHSRASKPRTAKGSGSPWVVGLLALACTPLALVAFGWAADASPRPTKVAATRAAASQADDSAATADKVEMFAAMESGDLDVKFIPKDDREARIFFKNKTKRPLTVKLPEAFAAVPVLAQRGGPGGGMGGMGGGGMGGMNQGMGGGMGGMGGGMGGGMMGGGGMGGGMMNLPAEPLDAGPKITLVPQKTVSFKIATVCLEHGKRDPRPAIPYVIRPLESLTTKPGVAELLTMLGYGKLDQRGAQAAAWHLANDMSWDQLAGKRIQTVVGDGGSYFSPDQIAMGARIAEVSATMADTRSVPPATEAKSPGEAIESNLAPAAPARRVPAR